MKVIELTAPRLDAFRPAAYPDPVPAYGEVLVRLRGASLNFLDLAVATGKYPLSSLPIMARTRPATTSRWAQRRRSEQSWSE